MEGLMLSAAGLSPASESLAFAAFAVVCVFVALLTVWALRTVRRERAGRVAAERASCAVSSPGANERGLRSRQNLDRRDRDRDS